ncbi:hypothetical protein K3495_g1659 [Podosphaera aphanis]|nr:hypothetical protein K3495_g1659 [Podosphaera aphanis]
MSLDTGSGALLPIAYRLRVVRSSNVRFYEDSYASNSPIINQEPYNCNPPIQVGESNGVDTNTSDQSDTSYDLLSPFERLRFDENQRDVEIDGFQAESSVARDQESLENQEDLSQRDRLPEIIEPSQRENLPTQDPSVEDIELPETAVTRRSTYASDEHTAFRCFLTASQSLLTVDDKSDPKTLAEAMSYEDSKSWREAIDREYRSLAKKETWSLVRHSELPHGTKVLTGKLVLKAKRGKQEKILKRKARWVVKGFKQEYGCDYTQTHAGVCRTKTWKIAIALAAKIDLVLEQMDAVTAILNSDADTDIYVQVPPGWKKPGSFNISVHVLWQRHLRGCLAEVNFEPLASDNCLSLNKQTRILIVTYVDDFLSLGKHMAHINQLKKKLADKFQLEDLRPASYFLGVRITRDRHHKKIYLNQDAYARQILERSGLETFRPVDTPIAAGFEKFLVPNYDVASKAEIEKY